jgi:hypothetical protein
VERFEEVRLADAVWPDDQDEPRLERKVEGGVRAKAPKRCPYDDQPASLIGMIR